jgi:hypothetical protein
VAAIWNSWSRRVDDEVGAADDEARKVLVAHALQRVQHAGVALPAASIASFGWSKVAVSLARVTVCVPLKYETAAGGQRDGRAADALRSCVRRHRR